MVGLREDQREGLSGGRLVDLAGLSGGRLVDLAGLADLADLDLARGQIGSGHCLHCQHWENYPG